MRILLLSGTPTGGSARSQRELADALVARGHEVSLLFRLKGHPFANFLYTKLVNASTKLSSHRVSGIIDAVGSHVGSRIRRERAGTAGVQTTLVLENALPAMLSTFRPDVVVASSVARVAWRRIYAICHQRGCPAVLYLREEPALGHLSVSRLPGDLLLANTDSLSVAARRIGYECHTVPSLVDLTRVEAPGPHDRVLVVNPIPSHGVEIALAVAELCPDIPFVFQESWRLEDPARNLLEQRLGALPNAEFRSFTDDPRSFYSLARLLLLPHQVNNRPRVVLEAQHNGIPVLGSDWGGIREAVGAGGVLVPPDAPADQWARALSELWANERETNRLSEAARRHAGRDEVSSTRVAELFETFLGSLLGRVGPSVVTAVDG